MKFRCSRINLYFLALAAVVLVACETTRPGASGAKQGAKDFATVRLHLETHPDPLGMSRQVTVGRENPQTFFISSGPMLGEPNLVAARIWEGVADQFAIHLQFDRQGAQTLESLSMSYRGKRLAIMSQFPEPRWIGSFRMERRIADGALLFRPDATRAEADRIVAGLNHAVARLKRAGE